jgi:hypothetical protein
VPGKLVVWSGLAGQWLRTTPPPEAV